MRKCNRCGLEQELSEFYKHSAMRSGRLNTCRTCTKEASKKWRDENRDRFVELRWRRELQSKYGITADDYWRMYNEQGGVCAACGSDSPGIRYKRVFTVDHCHVSGRVRGLLCGGCNMALGQMCEDPEKIRGLAAYAERTCRLE